MEREETDKSGPEGGQDSFSGGLRPKHQGEAIMARKDAILNMRKVLIRRRDALRKALAGDLSLLNQLRQQSVGDVVDAALDSAQDEISSQLAEVESRELANIERALELMLRGQYGVCEYCHNKIPMARLNALPYATSCIQCQREAEQRGDGGGHAADWSRILDTSLTESDVTLNDLELDVS
jgi:DnaK suppressor protein